MSANQDTESTSTRPYLIRAIHEWCCDNGYTPHITVLVDRSVQVPLEYVKDGEIVLNVGLTATTGLQLGNDYISFKARFSGAVRDIMVPVDQVIAVFARENRQGMAFPQISKSAPAPETDPPKPAAGARPALKRIK
ncbi:ClpXP protease specificity-enhancing factor [Rhodoferax antarcticus]|uniref:ClpXP protease specificity-enhancing factor n=1 Tax=Rhodoferax antarcticus TaxID=81479 RepID=UPI0022248E83|nr:ClpXP protease specificity-enhancing factor [Rhodoferax antarcticus]MCW2311732.1 stringent starvation protein B [Rhodoferax antarcticus]